MKSYLVFSRSWQLALMKMIRYSMILSYELIQFVNRTFFISKPLMSLPSWIKSNTKSTCSRFMFPQYVHVIIRWPASNGIQRWLIIFPALALWLQYCQILFNNAQKYSYAPLLVHLYFSYITSLLNDGIEKCLWMGLSKNSTHGRCHSDDSVCCELFDQVRNQEFDKIFVHFLLKYAYRLQWWDYYWPFMLL
jgi:hypothetical protein